MSTPLHNEMILASAGSGKTYTLVNRFLHLLRAGVPPEKLLALTFTRKAAGEFYAKILMRLAEALADQAKRKALADVVGMPELTQEHVCQDLRNLIQAGLRLQLGTLDAFFVRILQTFYLEFGFSAGFTLLDDHGAREAQRRAQEAAFKQLRDEQGVTAFLEAMRQATFGSAEKSLQRHLKDFVAKFHGIFLKGPDQELWGGEAAIWPKGCPWLQGGALDVDTAASALMESVQADARYTPKRDMGGWEKAVGLFVSVRPDQLVRKALNTVAERLLEASATLADGTAEIKFGKKVIALSADQCRHAFTLVHHVMRCEILAAQKRTHGLWQVLATYEQAYHREVRAKGQLTFSDVQRLLAQGDLALTQETSVAETEGRLLEIAYRLDARSDHWMLDEFQDTSRAQWRIISNLVDEVVQGGLPDRSLFYVGDVKQAIYGWRDGDARLFHQIFDHYNQGREGTEGAIRPVTLNESYRCCQTVIDAVNRVFGSDSTLQFQFGSALADRWKRVWGEHTTHVDAPGYVTLLNPIKAQSARSVEEEARYALAAETLVRLGPIERGLSCGVLVRQNKVGRHFTDYLRRHTDLPVESESDVHVVADNPVTAGFLSLFTAAAHPGDTLSWQHLWLTPFALVLRERGWGHPDLVREILSGVHSQGFESVIRQWQANLSEAGVALDSFSLGRLEALCDGAASFDVRHDRSLTRFVDFAQRYVKRQQTSDGVVQVMSIHKAKGLEFDVVLLLLAGTDDLRSLPHLSVVAHADEEEPILATGLGTQRQLRWALDMPRPTYTKVDPVMREVWEAHETAGCYENLCLLYVAMTRAKRALYIQCDPVGASSTSNNYSRLLQETLVEGKAEPLSKVLPNGEEHLLGQRLYSHGPGDWFSADEVPGGNLALEPVSQLPQAPFPLRPLVKATMAKRRPSQSLIPGRDPVLATGWELLSERASTASDYGTLIHRLFETIEWLEDHGDRWEETLPEFWDQQVPISDDSLRAKAHQEVLTCLNAPQITGWFSRTTQGGDRAFVWREKPFDVVLDGEWISGVFDRVVVNAEGEANIIDFKSNRFRMVDPHAMTQLTDKYAPQMADYRKAYMAIAEQSSEVHVTCRLLFTDTAQISLLKKCEDQ